MSHSRRLVKAVTDEMPKLSFAAGHGSLLGVSIEAMKKEAYVQGMMDGHKGGYQDGLQDGLRYAYAACALALHEKYGFGVKRIRRAMKCLDEHVITAINPMELIEKVENLMDYRIYFRDDPDCPFDSRIANQKGEQTNE